jgi:hypothetical protein
MFRAALRWLMRISDSAYVEARPVSAKTLSRRAFAAVVGGAFASAALPRSVAAAGCKCDSSGDCKQPDCEPDESANCPSYVSPPWIIEGGEEHCWCVLNFGDGLYLRQCDCLCDDEACICQKSGVSQSACTAN